MGIGVKLHVLSTLALAGQDECSGYLGWEE